MLYEEKVGRKEGCPVYEEKVGRKEGCPVSLVVVFARGVEKSTVDRLLYLPSLFDAVPPEDHRVGS